MSIATGPAVQPSASTAVRTTSRSISTGAGDTATRATTHPLLHPSTPATGGHDRLPSGGVSRIFAMVYRVLAASEEACGREWRSELLSGLSGTVVEVGAGTGLNLAHYPAAVERLVLTEPDPHMRARLQHRLYDEHTDLARRAELVDATADRLPLADGEADAVVSTLVLCSVPDQRAALAEIRRVLRPGGTLTFMEHVLAPEKPRRARWQRRLTPVWRRVADGCHLDRETHASLGAAGLEVTDCTRASMRKAAPIVRTMVRGHAVSP
jgi:SAM-dependent methyltransferase